MSPPSTPSPVSVKPLYIIAVECVIPSVLSYYTSRQPVTRSLAQLSTGWHRLPKLASSAAHTSSYLLRMHTLRSATKPAMQAARSAHCVCRPAFSASGRSQRAQRRRCVGARAWNDNVKFSPAKIVSSTKESANMHIVVVDVGKEVAAGYEKEGQYLQMKVGDDGKPAYLAIACAREAAKDGQLEFLIKNIPDSNHADIIGLGEGSEVQVSAVAGKGFLVDSVPPSEVDTMLIFATGSGISPVKALIDANALKATERKDVRLYYGVHDQDHLAYGDRIPEWEDKGVNVIKVFATRGEGYVQDVFADDTRIEDGSKTCALLCGQKEMAFAVKDMLSSQGVPDERFLTNF